jgi:hypothetical protein
MGLVKDAALWTEEHLRVELVGESVKLLLCAEVHLDKKWLSLIFLVPVICFQSIPEKTY